MPKKSTASKPLPPNYIALDINHDELIVLGSKEQVLDYIKSYCESEGMDEDDVQSCISIYELGKQIDLQVANRIEVYF